MSAPAPIKEKLLDAASGFLARSWLAWFRDVIRRGSWNPAFTGLSTTGSVSVTGWYAIVGNILHFSIEISGGTCTSALGSTFISNLPVVASRAGAAMVMDGTSRAQIGAALVPAGDRKIYTPTWAATGVVTIVGSCIIAD